MLKVDKFLKNYISVAKTTEKMSRSKRVCLVHKASIPRDTGFTVSTVHSTRVKIITSQMVLGTSCKLFGAVIPLCREFY